jgi:hypothetical protein
VHACDMPEKFDALTEEFSDNVRRDLSHVK